MVPAGLDIAGMALPPCITHDDVHSDPTQPLSSESRSSIGNALAKLVPRAARGGTLDA